MDKPKHEKWICNPTYSEFRIQLKRVLPGVLKELIRTNQDGLRDTIEQILKENRND